MRNFKSTILKLQGKEKKQLFIICSDKYTYHDLFFYFGCSNYRNTEKMILYVDIPSRYIKVQDPDKIIVYENYLLKNMYPLINELSCKYTNTAKNTREKSQFFSQSSNNIITKKSGLMYDCCKDMFVLKIAFNVPLVNALHVDAKAMVRAIRDILEHIRVSLDNIDMDELNFWLKVYDHQQQIRRYMNEQDLCVFIANGSILPRENGTAAPMKNAIPFISPKELKTTISFSDGTNIIGMGIKKGVTVITGGGYSGKSTLLDAIEMGIYDHIPGDGREFVLTDNSALKIYAEDGRPVSDLDLSPFFKYLPGNVGLQQFSTPHASGSVSQAANIIEAVCGKCRLLLIDEDKSATNFMIRDKNMRLIVKDEPIIPFTDRVQELCKEKSISTILVIGGSSEYLSYADTVILMENYVPRVVTEDIRKLNLSKALHNETSANWIESRRIVPRSTSNPFLYFRSVETENEKKIILDEYSADITLLTALISGYQLNTLACVMERLLTDKEADMAELLEKAAHYTAMMLEKNDTKSLIPEVAQRFYEDIRPIDAYCCANRMRGLCFKIFKGDMQ